MYVYEIDDTPRLTIDLNIMEKNIRDMQAYCNLHGFSLRPHIKTHKIPEIAHIQLREGAVGIACQKITEAEQMVNAGVKDILIYYNILGKTKLERLTSLAKRANISVAIDSEYVLLGIAEAVKNADCRLGVMIDCDTGFHRTGVQTPEHALRLAKQIILNSNLSFLGLSTYPFSKQSAEWFEQARLLFKDAKIEIPCISGGSTSSPQIAHEVGNISELRTGTYVYYDRTFVKMGIASYEQCALRIITTVVSRPTKDIVILDSGSKTLTSDRTGLDDEYGTIIEYPDASIFLLSEEHGHVDFSRCSQRPNIGERVTIIPNHACGTTNMHDQVFAVRDGVVQDTWQIAARGKVW